MFSVKIHAVKIQLGSVNTQPALPGIVRLISSLLLTQRCSYPSFPTCDYHKTASLKTSIPRGKKKAGKKNALHYTTLPMLLGGSLEVCTKDTKSNLNLIFLGCWGLINGAPWRACALWSPISHVPPAMLLSPCPVPCLLRLISLSQRMWIYLSLERIK